MACDWLVIHVKVIVINFFYYFAQPFLVIRCARHLTICRVGLYTHFFRYRGKRNATELSKAFWNAKDNWPKAINHIWSTDADQDTAYQPGSRSCNINLCLTEKLTILLADNILCSTKDQAQKQKFCKILLRIQLIT